MCVPAYTLAGKMERENKSKWKERGKEKMEDRDREKIFTVVSLKIWKRRFSILSVFGNEIFGVKVVKFSYV